MKLLNKSTLYFVIFLLPVFIVSGFVFYFIISKQISNGADETLLNQRKIIIQKLKINKNNELEYLENMDNLRISEVYKKSITENIFSDTLIFDKIEMEFIPYRKLNSYFTFNKKYYNLQLTRSTFESDELIESIFTSLIILFCLILLAILAINRFIGQRLFYPFYETLKKLNLISFTNPEISIFNSVHVKEFDELNKVLNKMTKKLFADYNNQKQFTENASHELQTPLAVIKTRMDMLIQDSNLSQESMEQIQEIEKSVNKLSHLNKSLLLLSKIENHQFDDSVDIDLCQLIEKIIESFEDGILNKSIVIKKVFDSNPLLQMNGILAEILFLNLLQNAIRHNIQNGEITIEIKENYFLIANIGLPLYENEAKLFDRFAKFNPSVQSIGLGLSIVKQICEYYNFSIHYYFMNGLHNLKIIFKT